MEEYKRIKLVRLSRTELRNKEMGLLKGGLEDKECCGCGYGTDNRNANSSAGYGISKGDTTGDCWNWHKTENGYVSDGHASHC